MIAPRVSTWMTFADGKEGVFEDIQARGLQRLSAVYQIYELKAHTSDGSTRGVVNAE